MPKGADSAEEMDDSHEPGVSLPASRAPVAVPRGERFSASDLSALASAYKAGEITHEQYTRGRNHIRSNWGNVAVPASSKHSHCEQ